MSEPTKAVFLSYASQDAEAAKRICEALRAAGVEVWFDTDGGLEHGDEWDAKIRRQIKECVLFLPIISANTQAREEGYFRLEWDLAVERARTIASGVAFILPVVIDDTKEPAALVPDRFRTVQWTKLPGGTVPPEVLQRFLRLWSHRTGLLKQQAAGGRQQVDNGTQHPEPGAQNRAQRPRWLPRVIGGVGVVAIALLIARPWQTTDSPRPAPRTERTASAPASEAQPLTAKAWALMNKPDLARAELETADGYCKRATELEPNDADAWAAWSQVDSWTVYHNFDASPGRREAARSKATHAMQIAAAGYEPRLAQACFLVRGQAGGDATLSLYAGEAEKLLRALLQEKAEEPRALLALGILMRNTGRFPECRDAFNRMARDQAFAAQAWNELGWAEYFAGDYAAAAVAIDRSIALLGYWGNLALKQILAQWWQGDLDLAKATLERMPMAARQEDIGISSAIHLAYWRREPETMLQLLDGVPRDWLQSNGFTGPTAWWAGLAHRMAGREAAAQVQWRTALALIERRLAAQPDSGFLLHWKAALLAEAGDRDAAEPVLKLAQEIGTRSSATATAKLLALLGHSDAAIDLLEKQAGVGRKSTTAAAYRLDPDLDALRNHPRFQALLARMEADPRFSPKAVQKTEDGGQKTVPPASLSPQPDAKSVAVLAFANLSDDKGNEYFSDGISEELLNVLAKVPGLKVSARTSAFYFKGKEVPIPEIARQLGVAYVIEGSVRKQGDKVRITAQLIKAADGFHVWSDTFTRDLKDIFAVQDEIAGLIAKNLELKMGLGPNQAHHGVDPEALRLMLEGRYFLTLRSSAGFDRADHAFTAALKIDPQFAQAQAGLASTTALRGRYRLLDGVGRVEEFDQLAITQSRLALQMDPTLAEPHAALGFVYTDTWQLADAEQEFQLAIGANPNFATAYHWHSHVLAAQGRLDLALQEIERAEALDPVSFIILFIRGFYLSDAHRYPEALETLDRAAAIRGETFLPLESDRARVLLALGRTTEAFATARKILQDPRLISSGWYAAGEALYVLHSGGAVDEANRLAVAILQAMPEGSYQRGYVLCAIGRFSEGMLALAHIPDIVRSRLYWHPMLDPVRDTPEFRQMLQNFKTVEEYQVARATLARMLKERGK